MFCSFFFMASVMATETSMAERISQCPVDTVPIQIMAATERGKVTAVMTLTAARVPGFPSGFSGFQGFPALVTAVTEHIEAKLAKDKICLDSAESKERSLLQFVPLHISVSGDVSMPQLYARPSGGCRISSPWIDLAIELKPVPWIRGIVRWNERQLLADQAVLAGVRNVPPGVAIPLKSSEFTKYAFDYAHSEILRKPAVKSIEERVPPDLLWLFRHAWQSTRGPFNNTAYNAMTRAMEKGAAGYTMIVLALIDHCFTSDGVNLHYSSILDVADLIPLEPYKIITLID